MFLSPIPGNRVPEDGEANICKGKFLLKEISIINPKVVVPLGNTACLHLLGRDGISNLHGKVIEHSGMVYVPCFHPAAVVYNRITLVDLLGALKRVKNICE